MINVGLIGCGSIAQIRHIPEYVANKNCKIYGVYDLNFERASEIAKTLGAKAYQTYEELLQDENIDAVSVLSPNFLHAEHTINALNSKKHVLCEKPMATTLEECNNMIDASKKNGKKLMIGHNQRFAAAHIKAKELIESGAIGDVISFTTTFAHPGADSWSIDGKNSWFMDKSKGCFGVLADLGIHKSDLIIYLLNSKIAKVSACISTLDKKDSSGNFVSVDDNAFCTYVMENNAVGTMRVSWTNYGSEDNSTSLFGTKGAMHIYKDPNHSIVLEKKDGTSEYFDVEAIQTNDNQTSSGIIDAFVNCIVNDTKPQISGEDVLPAMKATFMGVKSSQQNSAFVDVV